MEKSMSNKFKTNFKFVRPLYRKTKINDCDKIVKSSLPVNFDRNVKRFGDDFNVKTVVTKSGANFINIKRNISKEYKVLLPGACESGINEDLKNFKHFERTLNKQIDKRDKFISGIKMMNDNGTSGSNIDLTNNKIEISKLSQENMSRTVIYHKMPDTWLRVYPDKNVPGESLYSIILRCFLCQLGLATFLILWTLIAVFVIQSYEGPQETKVSAQFEKEQNQLVIDLATELRQITPLSPRWRYAIEKRIEDERQLTMQAVGDGARLKPGQFWDLPGTFLFAVYVMTALGFGAPVPHTLWGRTSALLYAFLAVPTHIYLMVNASTCMIVHVEEYTRHLKDNFCGKLTEHKHNFVSKRESAECSHNSEISKTSNRWNLRRKMIRCFGMIGAGRCVPLATISYYLIGVVAFGILRNKTPLETAMFPLEFTTTGGLEHVEGYVRILYGFYVEGAMCLLACILATIRRHGSSLFSSISETCRLFETDVCNECPRSKERV